MVGWIVNAARAHHAVPLLVIAYNYCSMISGTVRKRIDLAALNFLAGQK